jgi:TFA2 Winged helix domain 2
MSKQANLYGLDFLKTEHTLDKLGEPQGVESSIRPQGPASSWDGNTRQLAEAAALKSNLEKRYDVIKFLKANRSGGHLFPQHIFERTGIELQDDKELAKIIQESQNVRVEQIPDPENPSLMIATYAYQSKFPSVRDRKSLLAQINRAKEGVSFEDLIDSYDDVENDLDALITAGDIIAIANTEDKKKILFPRGEPFLTELDGIISLPVRVNGQSSSTSGSTSAAGASASTTTTIPSRPIDFVSTDTDPCSQIRRGEAIQIGGTWFRVSSKVQEGSKKDQPQRAVAPLSVVSLDDMAKRNVGQYIRKLSEKSIPTDSVLPRSAMENLQKAKEARELLLKAAHGRTGSAASKLLGSDAYYENPGNLATQVGTHASGARKRPNTSKVKGADLQHRQKQEADAAKKAAQDPKLYLYSHARRHGCTKDVRSLYLATRSKIPSNEQDLKKMLVENKLLEPDEQMRRPRMEKRKNGKDNDGKPKKKRYYERKGQRMTNTHLDGTAIGAVLAQAFERQRQGEQVGDGGM